MHKIVSFFLFLCTCTQIYSVPHRTKGSEEYKIKVRVANVSISEEGMYYMLNGMEIPISNLECENGSYTAVVPKGIAEAFGLVWCYKCQKWNSKFDSVCHYCGQPL